MSPTHMADGAGDWGRPDAEGQIVLPPRAPLSMEQLSGAGAYLLDNGRMLVLWLGHAASTEFVSQVRRMLLDLSSGCLAPSPACAVRLV